MGSRKERLLDCGRSWLYILRYLAVAEKEWPPEERRAVEAVVMGANIYRCLCGAVFDEPLKVKETINHGDGILEHGFYLACPSCGCEEPYFDRIEEGEKNDAL